MGIVLEIEIYICVFLSHNSHFQIDKNVNLFPKYETVR